MNCCRNTKLIDINGGIDRSFTMPKNYVLGGYSIKQTYMGGKSLSADKISLQLDENLYKKLLIKHDPNSTNILAALDIVKKYVIREKLIIVGGMAIDFALRLRGSKLYSDDEIPDYDFITFHHWHDAYEITQWLNRVGMRELSVINAMHPTTMRVRVYSIPVADVTFVPKLIFETIPRLNYHGFDFVHPFYQYIDQHRALSYGYENIDLDRPVLRNRWAKDMKRYELLWEKYPLKWEGDGDAIQNIAQDTEKVLPLEVAEGQCISGFLALQYWINWAEKKGFISTQKLGHCEITKTGIIYIIPVDSHGISFYTNDIADLYRKIKKKYKPKAERFYERYLDKLPRKIILDNEWEILDNKHYWLAASKVGTFYIANLQPIMLYMLMNYIMLNKMKGENRGYAFYSGYMLCRELLKYGAANELAELLPIADYYGKDSYSEAYLLAKQKYLSKTSDHADVPKQPRPVYDRDLRGRQVPKEFYTFDPNESEIFRMSGEQCKKFI